jgi:type IX secretion system PorP/SprF family membrane protein
LRAQEGTYWLGLSLKNPAAIATPSDWINGIYSHLAYDLNQYGKESFNSYTSSFDFKISQKIGSIGLDINYLKYQNESATLIKANYAYDIRILNSTLLSFGVSAGTTFYKTDYSLYEIYPGPGYTPPTDYNFNSFNGNAGIFLHSTQLSTGLSVTFEKQISGEENINRNFPTQLTGVVAYRVINNEILIITPNFMADYSTDDFYSIPGLQIEYKKLIWAGYQNFDFKDFHSINLGVDIMMKFRIGYSYSFNHFMNTEGLNTHEFVLGYRLQ